MKNFNKYILAIGLMFLTEFSSAQSPEMADTFRAEGKIYVVVAIILIVLSGLVAYLFMLDRKLTRLERMMDEKPQTK
ncbi:MAG: CcmD family protein [Cyclobacteriaceae bacterium]